MADYEAKLPDYFDGVWSAEGSRTKPTLDKISQGHVVERPPFQLMNWIENRQDNAICYLLQYGISQWNVNMLYPSGGVVLVDKKAYIAKEKNKGLKPTESDKWELLFANQSDIDDLKEEIKKIKEQEGYLEKYVSKAKPVMDDDCYGTGYGFKNSDGKAGLFIKDNIPIVMQSDKVVASFDEVLSVNEDNDKVVTMSVLKKILEANQAFKKGSLYITVSEKNPFEELGYGDWELHAQGCALVGLSVTGNNPNWTRQIGNEFGEYTHNLTVDELPKFSVKYDKANIGDWVGDSGRNGGQTINSATYFNSTDSSSVGGNQSHNNVQPSLVVAIWRRIG